MSQVVCPSVSAPPLGCAQYHTGTTGTVYSFNYASNFHLSNLDYKWDIAMIIFLSFILNFPRVCIRREKGFCTVTWTSTRFSISASPLPLVPAAQSGDILCTYDWIAFPGNHILYWVLEYDFTGHF